MDADDAARTTCASARLVPSADLFMRASASPSASETNITAAHHRRTDAVRRQGRRCLARRQEGRLRHARSADQRTSRPEEPAVLAHLRICASRPTTCTGDRPGHRSGSADGQRRLAALPARRPHRVLHHPPDAVDRRILLDEGKPQFAAQNEDAQEPAFVLQVMNADGTGMHQISFNQSHDRDADRARRAAASCGPAGTTRPGKDAMHLYSSNPDGTDLQLTTAPTAT